MRLRARVLKRASKIFDNRIDWVVVTTRLSSALAKAEVLAKLSVFRYQESPLLLQYGQQCYQANNRN